MENEFIFMVGIGINNTEFKYWKLAWIFLKIIHEVELGQVVK